MREEKAATSHLCSDLRFALQRYGEIQAEVNLVYDLAGAKRIVSVTRLDAFRTAVVVTQYNDYFGASEYSTLVSLLIAFLVITPGSFWMEKNTHRPKKEAGCTRITKGVGESWNRFRRTLSRT